MRKSGSIRFLRYRKLIILCSVTTAILIAASCFQKKATADTGIVSDLVIAQIDSFSVISSNLLHAVKQGKEGQYLQAQFLQLRLVYKKAEWAIEYFCPIQAIALNGPPVPEIEPNEIAGEPPLVKDPGGLQMIEPLLFPRYDTTQKKELLEEIAAMQDACGKIKNKLRNVPILDWQVFDAAKLEVFRIITMGITGFDAPVSLNSIAEASVALSGIATIFRKYDPDGFAPVMSKIDNAVAYLEKNKNDFNRFDRATFIINYANPVSGAIREAEIAGNVQEYNTTDC